ncbi:MAG: hypothetical protein GVY02_01050, partial [Bacteroidetes bacterium]|nr:hypothetical protein [Bacteroidota bacterium]
MSTESQLPENDRDLRLARMFKQARAEGSFPGPDQNPLFGDLNVYRELDHTLMEAHEIESDSIWNRVMQDIEESNTPVYRLLPGSSMIRWAAAAAILITLSIGIYFVYEASTPALIADAGSETTEIILEDGSSVTLRPYSQLYRDVYSSTEHTYTLTGEGYFRVEANPNRTFSVLTESARITVLGTTYVLSGRDDQSTVFLEEGRLRFER